MLALARDLPAFGWEVDVLTVCASALPDTSAQRQDDIPADTRVIRSCALDTARHLSLFGKYPRFLGLPDRWVTWRLAGVFNGLRHIRRYRPDAIMSSFPIATAHVVAADLARLTDLPWLADFRDPMAQDEYPKDPAVWRSFMRVEQRVVAHAAALTFTTASAQNYYMQRYGERLAGRSHVVANGYEEDIFAQLEQQETAPAPHSPSLRFLHSGLLYPWERDPVPFFHALKALDEAGFWQRYPSRFIFRASGHDAHFAPMVAELGLAHLVQFEPRIEYREALREILDADVLVLFQAANSNFQIPAKAYEYLRARRPILAVVDPAGDTAGLLKPFRHAAIAAIDSESAIREALEHMVPRVFEQQWNIPTLDDVSGHSRRESARVLADVLARCIASRPSR